MEICTKSWCAAVLTLIFKVICLVIMGLEHWTRLCVSSKRGNLEWDYCWTFSFSKQKERESLRGGRDQLRIPCTPPLQVVTVWTKNSSQYSLVKKKKYVAGISEMKHKSFRALVLAVPSSGLLLARPSLHFLYLNIYQPHSFLSTGLLASGREGNGNPLQYSYLGNPRDGEAWWAQSMGLWRVRHDWVTSLSLFTFMHWRRKWQPTPVLLPGKSQGLEPDGPPSMGLHRVRHNWCDLAAATSIWGPSAVSKVQTLLLLHHSMVQGSPEASTLGWGVPSY